MRLKFILSILPALVILSPGKGQTITGTVAGAGDRALLPYVNIGIKGKNVGAVSKINGSFSIAIPSQNENDTLTFSMAGYDELNLPIRTAADLDTFFLKEKTVDLEPVRVVAHKMTEQKLGIKNKNNIHLIDASMNHNDVFEIAQLIRLDNSVSKITSVNLLINEARGDSATFRINFYAFEKNRPGKRMFEKSIVQTKEIKAGWLKFDIGEYNVYPAGNFVVGIEFIPAVKKSKPITYEAKLGGWTKSFVRKSSQGEWDIPFHHYRLFVTALVPEDANLLPGESDEKESAPDTVFFSKAVGDSFRIFVSVPKGYVTEGKKYPVVYVLDANVYFDILGSTMQAEKSEAILVGIGYRDFLQMDSLRDRDYTFPEALPEDSFHVSGGGKKFYSFIRDELIPFVETEYAADPRNRTLMGHSLGGYFTLFALEQGLINGKSIFRNYVAPSPELKYHNDWIINEFGQLQAEGTTAPLNLFLTFGKLEDSENGGTGTRRIDNFNRFTEIMRDKKYNLIKLNSVVYPSYMHMETAIPTFLRAIKRIK